jgi:hypothetical protein
MNLVVGATGTLGSEIYRLLVVGASDTQMFAAFTDDYRGGRKIAANTPAPSVAGMITVTDKLDAAALPRASSTTTALSRPGDGRRSNRHNRRATTVRNPYYVRSPSQ